LAVGDSNEDGTVIAVPALEGVFAGADLQLFVEDDVVPRHLHPRR
jgi:hypothetical protein